MKLYVIDDKVFYPLTEDYLLFICWKKEVYDLTETELNRLINQAITAKLEAK